MDEKDYYENESFWTKERYLNNDQELIRFKDFYSLIPTSASTVLDVGCGNGAFLKYLEDNNSNIISIGYERSQTAIANKVCKSQIIAGSADRIEYPDNSFDVVLALEVIEHLPFGIYESSLKELQRIASKYIIISVPFRERQRLIKCPYCGCSFSPYYHLRSFNEKTMKTIFEGFELLKFSYISKYRDYYVWNFLKRIWYAKIIGIEKKIPVSSLCPQCGFHMAASETPVSQESHQNHINKLKSRLRMLTPYRNTSIWLACIYQKRCS